MKRRRMIPNMIPKPLSQIRAEMEAKNKAAEAAKEAKLENEADQFEAQQAARKAALHGVHWFTAMLPMMSDRELDALAADIKTHGQFDPIIYDANGVLVDGRCRLEACRRAGIEPKSITLSADTDPFQISLANNMLRQNLTTSQQAMLLVTRYPEASLSELVSSSGLSRTKLFLAMYINQYAPAMASSVIDEKIWLHEIYNNLKSRVDRARNDAARFKLIQRTDPDLAEAVTDERLGIEEAWAEFMRLNPRLENPI